MQMHEDNSGDEDSRGHRDTDERQGITLLLGC